MQVVIDISEELYERMKATKSENCITFTESALVELVQNGTPLKGHGRLSDMDELVKKIVNEYGVNSVHELPQDIKAFYGEFIKSAPTVLDAMFDYKLKNYACVKGVEE